MHLREFDYFLWTATPTVQLGVWIAMYRRKLHSFYPWFFRYTILQVLSTLVLVCLFGRSYTGYYYGYYVNACLTIFLSFAVLHEASRSGFQEGGGSRRVLQLLWTAGALVGLMMLNGLAESLSAEGRLTHAIMLMDRFVRVLEIVLLAVFAIFSARLRLSKRSFVYGIALGLGLFAVVNTLDGALMSRARMEAMPLARINGLAYFAATLIWLEYSIFGSPDPRGTDSILVEPAGNRELPKWGERNFRDPLRSAVRP